MRWLLLILCFSSLAVLIECYFTSHASVGAWAFRADSDGRFSKYQIAIQIALIGLPAILCLWVLFLCIADFARRLLNA